MGKKKDLSPAKIREIKTLLMHSSKSNTQIAAVANVSRQTVDSIKKKIEFNIALTPNREKKCGRKKSTTPRNERQIRDICVANRRSPRKLITKMIKDAGIEISDRTVRRRIKDLGFSCRRPAIKPLLTRAMMTKRLNWAKAHRNWTTEDWNKVIHFFSIS